ncbi:SPOR domain-containing protein [Aquisalimonas sp.]|uniref:SPOR domain-containing protein n=1 Tax=Aquisalimonas sp. TaxID=1872621 RepID=UPI0025BD0CE1|nr:SPOR domain-containing protein [Aquisalimonas sp.]
MANNKRSGAKRNPRPAAQHNAPRWVWFLSGLLPGLFIALLVHMHHARDDGIASLASGPESAAPGSADDGSDSSDRPRFEFYELLSEMEVVVPDEPEPDAGPTEQPATPAPEVATPHLEQAPAAADNAQETQEAQGDTRYMLQAGSFRSHEDADQLKARLALMGVRADIQSVEVDSGETWHRVRIGPFSDRERVDSLRSQLQGVEVDSLLLRTRG